MLSSKWLPEDKPGRFSLDYRRIVEDIGAAAESSVPDAPPPIKEKLLRCLWFEQYFDTARVERRLHNIYASLRPRAPNAVVKYMISRVFSNPDQAVQIVTSVRRQQGLLQIFHDFCETTDSTCETCGFLTAQEDCVE